MQHSFFQTVLGKDLVVECCAAMMAMMDSGKGSGNGFTGEVRTG